MNKSTHGGQRTRAGRKTPLSANEQTFVRANYRRMSSPEMAIALQLKTHNISNFLSRNGLTRGIPAKQKKDTAKILCGFFNVHSRENWAI